MPKFCVQQVDGEIVIATGGGPTNTYVVSGGIVDVPDTEVARFLSQVDGSTPASGTTAADEKES